MSERWGPWCVKCGHPASYHGVTFCMVEAGGPNKRRCDCDGYSIAPPEEPFAVEEIQGEMADYDREFIARRWLTEHGEKAAAVFNEGTGMLSVPFMVPSDAWELWWVPDPADPKEGKP